MVDIKYPFITLRHNETGAFLTNINAVLLVLPHPSTESMFFNTNILKGCMLSMQDFSRSSGESARICVNSGKFTAVRVYEDGSMEEVQI
jgi:hypothetical protein